MPKSKYTKKSRIRRAGGGAWGGEGGKTLYFPAPPVLSGGLPPAPDYFSAGSTWQAFEPS